MLCVPHDKLEQYLNFEIGEDGLFPADAPKGTHLSDLQPEGDDSAVCTLDHVSHAFEQFLDEEIDFEQFERWIGNLLELDLFVFDDTYGEASLNWMFDTLDYLAGFEDEDTILDKVDFTALMDKAESFKS